MDFQNIKYENQFKFCEKMIDIWDKHKLHVLYIMFYYSIFYFALFFVVVLFLVAIIQYYGSGQRYKYE